MEREREGVCVCVQLPPLNDAYYRGKAADVEREKYRCSHAPIYIFIYICIYVYIYICIYIYVCVCVCVYVRLYIYI